MQMGDTLTDIAALITAAGGALVAVKSQPAGVTSSNPYAPPSGMVLPPGVTAGPQYMTPAYSAQSTVFGMNATTIGLIAFGGLALLLILMKR